MASCRIVLANPHAPLREGLKRIFEEEPDLNQRSSGRGKSTGAEYVKRQGVFWSSHH